MPDDTPTESWFRRFAKREPLITRAAVSALVLAAAALASRYAGIDLDQDTIIAVLLGWLGITGAVIREGVTSPATVEKERQRAAEEALLAAPIGTATVVQVAPAPAPAPAVHVDWDQPDKPRAGLLDGVDL